MEVCRYFTFNHLYYLRFFAAFLIFPRQTPQQSLTKCATISYFAVHYSQPFCQSTLYNMPVDESSVINLRCPNFTKGNTITMGGTSSHASLSKSIPCVTVNAITTPELLFVQFITSYSTPVLQNIQVFWDIKV